MGTITPVVVPGEGYVRVEVNWADFPHTRKCWIHRRVAGVSTRVREGNAVPLSGGIAVAFDHEAPLDTPLTYRSLIALNANGDMEDGVAEWQDTTNGGTVGTVSQSKDYYVSGEGLASLKLVPSGAATSKAVSEFIPATAGQSYTIQGRLMVPDYWVGGIGVQIQWYNGLTPLTTVGAANDFSPYPGSWATTYGFSAAAPATTTQCKIVAAITGTPPTTLPLYADEMYLTTTGTTITAASDVVIPSDGTGWWTDPLHPATKTRLVVDLRSGDCLTLSSVVFCGVSEETFPADSGATEVNDAANPVGTWSARKSGRQSITVGTLTLADRDQLRALHATGAPLFLQLPPAYGEADSYGLYGDLPEGRLARDQRRPFRVITVAFTKMGAPIGPAEGTWRTRFVDLDRYATFADFAGSGGGGYDTYARVTANGWGTSTSGLVTSTSGGAASEYSTDGSQGVIAVAAVSVLRLVFYPVSVANFDLRMKFTGPTPAGGNIEQHLYARYVDASNYVRIRLFRTTGGTCTLTLTQVVAGVETGSGFVAVAGVAANSVIRVHFTGNGTASTATAWLDGTAEPQTPTISQTLSMVSAGQVATAALLAAATTGLPIPFQFDDLSITNLATAPTWLDGLQAELAV